MKKIFLLLFCLPFIVGTTYVLKEGDTEVGTYVEHDGLQKTEVVQAQRVAPRSVVSSPVSVELIASVEREKKSVKLAREKNDSLSIRPGLTRQEVEVLASDKGAERRGGYSSIDTSRGPVSSNEAYLRVLEYGYQTEHYNHLLKVFFGSDNKVKRMDHSTEKRIV